MTKHNDLWKPQPGDIPKNGFPKQRKKAKNRKQLKRERANERRKKQREITQQKIDAREYCLKHFGMQKYATNAAIAFRISKEVERPMPEKDKEMSKFIVMYWLSRTGQKPRLRDRYMTADEFYSSAKWKEIRHIALVNSEGRCNLCGASAKDGVTLHVDHIEPRSKAPKKQWDLDNLQVLCSDCNIGKSNYDDTDWR